MEKQEDEIFCPECAKPIKKDFTICPYCRTEIIIKKDSLDNVAVDKIDNYPTYSMSCPICNNSLTSYKVSAIYSNGVSTTSLSGSSVSFITPLSSKGSSSVAYTPINLTGINISELSDKLSPPLKPGSYSTGSCLMVFLIILAIQVGMSFLGAAIWMIAIPASAHNRFTAIFVILAMAVALGGFFIIRAIRNGIRGIGKQAESNKRNYENSLKEWQYKCTQWDNLYYCFKHDIIFDPSSGEYTSAVNLDNIYKN
jgi:hypothetical protein